MNLSLTSKIKEIAKENGVPIAKLERDLNFAKKSVSDWDEHRPSIDKVVAVADFFGVSIDSLLGRDSGDFLTAEERELLTAGRSMTAEGKAFLMQSAELAAARFKKTSSSNNEVTA